jgi:hypothetical protein
MSSICFVVFQDVPFWSNKAANIDDVFEDVPCGDVVPSQILDAQVFQAFCNPKATPNWFRTTFWTGRQCRGVLFLQFILSSLGPRSTQKSRPRTSKSFYSPGHVTYLDRHGIQVQHEDPDSDNCWSTISVPLCWLRTSGGTAHWQHYPGLSIPGRRRGDTYLIPAFYEANIRDSS